MVMPARCKRLAARLDRAQTHDLGVERAHAARDDPREGRDAELLGPRVAHHDDRGRAVVEGAGVARGHRAALAEHRLAARQLLERGARRADRRPW